MPRMIDKSRVSLASKTPTNVGELQSDPWDNRPKNRRGFVVQSSSTKDTHPAANLIMNIYCACTF